MSGGTQLGANLRDRTSILFLLLPAVISIISALPGRAGERSSLDQLADRVSEREKQLVTSLEKYSPLVEVYIQNLDTDRHSRLVPVSDEYFLGKAALGRKLEFHSLMDDPGFLAQDFNPILSSSYRPEAFVWMIYPDRSGFDRAHYSFQYVGREFLGEIRCIILDVTPKKNAGLGRFKGRLWVEDQDFSIVRFKGVFVPNTLLGAYFHFDSWRVNAGPGLWLPAYIYTEEADPKSMLSHIPFKAQTRLWAYSPGSALREEELGKILVETTAPVQDTSEAKQDYSPVESEHAFERQAEENAVDRLERAGLLSPRGEVDKVLETVVNNLEVSNNLNIQPEIHCRVLLTSTLESFSVGHTIVLSRGLIDVLPDEPSLAAILAQELADIALGRTIDTRYAFNDRLLFQDKDTFHVLNFSEKSSKQEQKVTPKVVALLENSPYKNSLASAGLFLKALDAHSKQLPQLISPHLGNRVYQVQALKSSAPQLEPERTDQIAALPLGSRLKINPWNDQAEMMKTQSVHLVSWQEKMPFEVTPFYPYLTRAASRIASAQPNAAPPQTPAKQDQ